MSSPQQWLYQQFVGEIPTGEARCYFCGASCPALHPTAKGIAETFNSHFLARCPSSPWLCHACRWYFDSKSLPAHPDFRKMSLIVQRTSYQNWERTSMKPFLEHFLSEGLSDDAFLVVSLSKKKHILLQAPLNAQGTKLLAIQVEEQIAHVDQSTWNLLNHSFMALLGLGHNKGEILSGNLYASTLRKHGQIRDALNHSAMLAPYRSGAALELLSYVTIVEKEEKDDATIRGDGVDRPGGAALESRVESDRQRVQSEAPHGHLDASRNQRGGVRPHVEHAEQVSQQSLF